MEAIFANLTVEKNVLAFNFFLSSANERMQVFPVGEKRGEKNWTQDKKKAIKKKQSGRKGQDLSQCLREKEYL